MYGSEHAGATPAAPTNRSRWPPPVQRALIGSAVQVNLHVLRVFHHGKRRTFVPFLAAGFLAAGLPFPAELSG